MKTSLEQEYGGRSKPYHLWAPPLLAFAGLALLLALGRNSWVYSLPYGQNNSQVLSIKTSLLRGTAEVPKSFYLGTTLNAGGWLGSVDPSIQPQNITLYLDGRPVAETSVFYPARVSSNGQSVTIKRWEVAFFVKDTPPGEHILGLEAAAQGREPIALAQTSILVLR
ncbi:MAG TPA: hypothetical protein VK738_11935 [Terriglobales bacterium]|jgi:hypothetical protein|nr:hypothetical protein [Terriglobales bacterium]